MFKRKQKRTGASTRAEPKARAELQHQLEERLSYWQLFLEAKQAELEERRQAGEFAPSEVAAVRATTAAPEPKPETPAAEETFF
jgi:hypothetical protein